MESNLKKDGRGTRGVIFAQTVRGEVSRCEGAGKKHPLGVQQAKNLRRTQEKEGVFWV